MSSPVSKSGKQKRVDGKSREREREGERLGAEKKRRK